MKSTLEILAEKHSDWIRIVRSFGCNQDTAQDVVQEMYIKIHFLISKGGDIMYNETEINHFYIFRTLRTMFIDLTRKQGKVNLISIDDVDFTDRDIKNIFKKLHISEFDELDNIEKYESKINVELDNMHWYDRKIYNHIQSGESIKSLSDKTKISYYSIYNTYNKVKKYLSKQIFEK
jgi:DNA-directed RNA polymerase specialized sigma24 family protein